MAVSDLPEPLARWLRASPSLSQSLPGIARAAASESPLLILGEPATGRSSLARALHGASGRAAGPFEVLDASVIPGTLFEGELFGYLPGAFTGAETALEGRVARAAGGTLILDRIEALPAELQPKLLRLLAEQSYTPLGGEERQADVRFLAIGPEDLTHRVEQGLFRADLYYRLEVLAYHLPPLRQRRDDLPTLARALLADLAVRAGAGTPPRVSARSWHRAASHDWPGNLRELRNLLERILVSGASGEVDLPLPPRSGEAPPRSLMEMEKEHIERTLAYTRGHQGRAADLLGISRKALWQKRKRYGLP